ncbi:DNA topoisomerase I [Quadrisphaera granulorum]|uniref:DNA topoisomerase 1 n=1 Tax=Quadrisphaera granulorum TaxID=317664 RepID=A0A316A7A4_9ACTN|nr:type I DNA topoisomerase [Quadrisphaera granulorum]PWJ53329.1 DNA topoisomerase I [Quadrisphaera granulorum]SZE97003.1 DNA topoisomerase I [Quadrisphaera granulorum]
MARSSTSAAPVRRLVIVESPAKARTIASYLGDGYEVEASVGHIRDLPQPSELPAEMKKGPFGKFAVDVDNGFEPYYVVDADKKKKVTELKRALKDADELYLATDEDREGEAIAWHLLQTLQPTVPVKRMVFHEITREAIQRALEATRDIDAHMVDAQETRRILDRLYGYEVSPVLWRKVRAGLSAGRVQSVATRMVVERERERMAFRSASYWDVQADTCPAGSGGAQRFTTRLVSVDGARVATGRDFADTGQLTERAAALGAGLVRLDEAAATAVANGLRAAGAQGLAVTSVETKPYSRKPAAPFTTSTLQQEASRKLGSSARQTMRTAQSLYENGWITYMRTDSVSLSQQAVSAARSQAAQLYGAEYVADKPRTYSSKAKNAQEAHEAIRPAGDVFRTPAQVAGQLRGEEFRLYEMIWQRTVASQMADARGSTATVRLGGSVDVAPPADAPRGEGSSPTGTLQPGSHTVELSASGTVITFRGFLAAYEEGRDEERHGSGSGDAERRLPQLEEGQRVDVLAASADGHETSPPPRYTEASLVKALEERGIGRPSTYAATIATISDRGYVWRRGTALVPSWLAFAVVRLLEDHFDHLVDYDFTAEMEDDLDRIASGSEDRRAWLSRFYFGAEGNDGGAGAAAVPGGGSPSPAGRTGLKPLVEHLGDIDARGVNSLDVGEGITLRVGRYGPYLEIPPPEGAPEGTEPQRASVPDDLAPDELTPAKARELLETAGDGERELGTDPATGRTIVARAGRFGPYVTEVLEEGAPKSAKPRTASLFKSMQLQTVGLDDALKLLSLPRLVGTDPATGEEITAQNGRYGPYLKKGTDSRSLTSEDQLFEVTLEEALALYAEPKRGRGGRAAAAPLRELGNDPVSGAPVVVKEGRFGPYVTDGTTNATLRTADTVEAVTLERAAELLAEKRAKAPAKGAKTTTKTTKTAAKTTKTTKTGTTRSASSRSAAAKS